MQFVSLGIDGVNSSVFKALSDVFRGECLCECWNIYAKELGSSHASTGNIEVVGYQPLLVPPLECSIRYIIKGLHDVGAVGGGGNSRPLYCAPLSTACI